MSTVEPPKNGPTWPAWTPRGDDSQFDLEDGDQVLVAVKCVEDGPIKREYWEYAVLTLSCDEDHTSWTCNGEAWCWDWEDVEYFITLSRKRLGAKYED